MASKFLTSQVVDPIKAPITAPKGLEHINSMPKEVTDALVRSMIESYTTDDLIILSGCVVTTLSGSIPGTGTASLSSGYIYRNGEIFEVDAIALLTTTANTLVWVADNQLRGSVQTKFSDGNDYDFLRIAKLKLQPGTSGSGLSDFDDTTVKNVYNSESGELTYSTGWGSSGGSGTTFKKLPFGDIEVNINLTISTGGTTTAGTIPSFARPTNSKKITISDYNGSDGASVLMIAEFSSTTLKIYKQSDGTKPANRGGLTTTVRYNIHD